MHIYVKIFEAFDECMTVWRHTHTHTHTHTQTCYVLTLRPGPKMLFQGDTPEGSDTFQWPVIKRDRVGGLRLMIWDKVKVPLCTGRE